MKYKINFKNRIYFYYVDKPEYSKYIFLPELPVTIFRSPIRKIANNKLTRFKCTDLFV